MYAVWVLVVLPVQKKALLVTGDISKGLKSALYLCVFVTESQRFHPDSCGSMQGQAHQVYFKSHNTIFALVRRSNI